MGSLILFTGDTAGAATIETFTGFGTTILTWLITTFGTLLNWMLANPIVFVGLAMSLIIAAIGTLRHLIGGKSRKETSDLPENQAA